MFRRYDIPWSLFLSLLALVTAVLKHPNLEKLISGLLERGLIVSETPINFCGLITGDTQVTYAPYGSSTPPQTAVFVAIWRGFGPFDTGLLQL